MLIVRVPFRISFFGGGTDFHDYFTKYGGQVVSFTIDKYCYVSIRNLPEFTEHNIKISYSKIEKCKTIDEIEHPLIKTALKSFNKNKLEIHYDADLPANSGLGSSSSFGVGLAHALSIMEGKKITKRVLAQTAIDWERNILKESGGYQDQIAAAYGGFNNIVFSNDSFQVKNLKTEKNFLRELLSRVIICYVPRKKLGISTSSKHFSEPGIHTNYLHEIAKISNKGLKKIFEKDIDGIGLLIKESWEIKKKFYGISTDVIDDLVDRGLNNGAIGAKLLGAGGGGFLMFFCSDNGKRDLINSIKPFYSAPINISHKGSEILFKN